MPNYDFHTLSSEDFELLIRDLLNARERARKSDIYFTSFSSGRDKGIDLLCSSRVGRPDTIVQVKRNIKTTFPTLYSQLAKGKNDSTPEVSKTREHDPEKYIFVTALGLNLTRKEKIKALFSPHIRTIEDVIDQTDINQLLGEYPVVEMNHFKLWLPSVDVLQRVLHNKEFSKAKHLIDSVTRKENLYVTPSDLKKAIERLTKENCLIITGAPGAGKTSFAELVIAKLISEGCSVFHIYNTVSEAESLLNDDSSCQLFYFDDFLGHTPYEIKQPGYGEYAFFQFLAHINSLQNKYLLLTTRTSILNDFENRSERYRNAGISKYRFNLSEDSFSEDKKVEIIINHIKANHIPAEYTKTVMEAPVLEHIARHANFSPRLIEFVTNKTNYTQTTPRLYYHYIIDHLDNPKEIWAHAYHHQLNDYDRFLLTTLFSFRAKVPKTMLEKAFNRRVQYEIEINHIPRANDIFLNTFRKLLDGFIYVDDSEKVDFLNPSIKDYLLHYLGLNIIENLRIANAVYYVEQILHPFLPITGKGLSLYPDEYLLNQMAEKGLRAAIGDYNCDPTIESTYLALSLSLILSTFYDNKLSRKLIMALLKSVDWPRKEAMADGKYLLDLLKRVQHIPGATKLISPWMNYVVDYIMQDYWELDSFHETVATFEAYDAAYTTYISDKEHAERIKNRIEWFVVGRLMDTIGYLKNNATSESQVAEARNKLFAGFQVLYDCSKVDIEPYMGSFDDEDWNEIIAQNIFNQEYFEKYF